MIGDSGGRGPVIWGVRGRLCFLSAAASECFRLQEAGFSFSCVSPFSLWLLSLPAVAVLSDSSSPGQQGQLWEQL